MHTITLHEKVDISTKLWIDAGKYIAENINGAQLIARAGDGQMEPLTEARPFDESKDWNGKKILFVRAGGYGDVIKMTPVLREIKNRWPNAIIGFATIADYSVVLANLKFVDKIEQYPIAESVAMGYDAWVFFEKAIERNPRAHVVEMTDLFAEITGLSGKNWTKNKKPEYAPSANELSWVEVQYPHVAGRRRIVIQVGASARCRMWPMNHLQTFINALRVDKAWDIFLIGSPGELGIQDTEDVHNLTLMPGLSFRQSAAVVSTADVFLGPDSAFAHLAGALDIPGVALFGPFPWKLRSAYHPSIRAIQGVGACSPCFHHENPSKRGDAFPKNCPSRDKIWPGSDDSDPNRPALRGYCEVLESIKPERVKAMIEKVAKKGRIELVP